MSTVRARLVSPNHVKQSAIQDMHLYRSSQRVFWHNRPETRVRYDVFDISLQSSHGMCGRVTAFYNELTCIVAICLSTFIANVTGADKVEVCFVASCYGGARSMLHW